jgi:hypothetical protein
MREGEMFTAKDLLRYSTEVYAFRQNKAIRRMALTDGIDSGMCLSLVLVWLNTVITDTPYLGATFVGQSSAKENIDTMYNIAPLQLGLSMRQSNIEPLLAKLGLEEDSSKILSDNMIASKDPIDCVEEGIIGLKAGKGMWIQFFTSASSGHVFGAYRDEDSGITLFDPNVGIFEVHNLRSFLEILFLLYGGALDVWRPYESKNDPRIYNYRNLPLRYLL